MRYYLILSVFLFFAVHSPKAQNTQQDLSYINNGAVGFYIGYPIGGVTGIYNPNAQLGLQGIVDVMGNRQSISGRIIYRFLTRERTNTFGYGMIGGYEGIDDPSFGLGFGAGAGVEYSWQSFSKSLPPIWGSAELGITSWDSAGGATTRITFSAGIYYYF
jgi:hypothetical protein